MQYNGGVAAFECTMVTTYDIARRTGLNQSTVSRVLSGFPHVHPATARKVREACAELGYVPNAMARGLKTRRTGTLAVHIPFGSETVLADPFIPAFLSGVSRRAARDGYSVVLSYMDTDERANDPVTLVKSGRADGVILTSPARSDPWIRELNREGIPYVVGRTRGRLGPRAACVDIDNVHAGKQAGRFLLARSHRRIGLVTESLEHYSGRDFYDGFMAAAAEGGASNSARYACQGQVTFEAGYAAARELLEMKTPPTAIIANTALTVFGAAEAVRALRRKVLVLGIESPLLRAMYPGQPRIRSPIEDLGSEMAAALIGILRSGRAESASKMLYNEIVDEQGQVFTG